MTHYVQVPSPTTTHTTFWVGILCQSHGVSWGHRGREEVDENRPQIPLFWASKRHLLRGFELYIVVLPSGAGSWYPACRSYQRGPAKLISKQGERYVTWLRDHGFTCGHPPLSHMPVNGSDCSGGSGGHDANYEIAPAGPTRARSGTRVTVLGGDCVTPHG